MTDAPAEKPRVRRKAGSSRMKISATQVDMIGAAAPSGEEIFKLPEWPAGVYPAGDKGATMAMDWAGDVGAAMAWAAVTGVLHEGISFMGYPYLSELTQRAEYRRPSEVLANEMTRKWIKVTGKGGATTDKVTAMEDALKRYDVQTLFRRALEMDGFMGRAQIFICVDDKTDGPDLALPLVADAQGRTVTKGAKLAFQLVEPMWCAPGGFNSTNPLDPKFYKPQDWFVMAQRVHTSRLLPVISREVPDILKPVYGFGGLSLSQMAKPYVDNWLRTRQSVSDLIHSFSTMILATDMGTALEGGAMDTLTNRAEMYNRFRDNRGLFMVNKETEELTNVATPLGTLDKLQAQSQEHMASVTAIPLIILLGITPSGLNASADGEIRVFYGWIGSQQEKVVRPPLQAIFNFVQLSEFGAIDPDLGFDFLPLWEEDEGEETTNRKTDADTDTAYINAGVLSPEDSRRRLAADPKSPYFGLDPADVPEPPVDPNEPPPGEVDPDEEEDPEDPAQDASFKEGDHPRAANGKFGAGGGSKAEIKANGEIHHDGQKVGRVKLDRSGAAFHIQDIELGGSHQGKGIGSDVIRAIQAEAKAAGKPVVLTTDAMRGKDAQEGQLRLYTRLGFVPNKAGPDQVFEKIGKRKVAEALVWRPTDG